MCKLTCQLHRAQGLCNKERCDALTTLCSFRQNKTSCAPSETHGSVHFHTGCASFSRRSWMSFVCFTSTSRTDRECSFLALKLWVTLGFCCPGCAARWLKDAGWDILQMQAHLALMPCCSHRPVRLCPLALVGEGA